MGFALMIGQVDMNSVRGTVAAMLGRWYGVAELEIEAGSRAGKPTDGGVAWV